MHERDLFLEAIELDPQERADFLGQACGGDENLKRRVESLLAASGTQDDVLKSPAVEEIGDGLFDVLRNAFAETQLFSETAVATGFNTENPEFLQKSMGDPLGYEILSELGRGGMGAVYKARDQRLNRLVAIKKIHSRCAEPHERLRFLQEAEAIAAIQHPNIVQVFEIGQHDDSPYICLELADQGSLADLISSGPMPHLKAAVLAEQVANGMNAAHQAGVVHRDLKPSNILITGEGQAKVTDFGIAKRMQHDSGLTETGAIMGTPAYMAPEQARGEGRLVGPAADVYAIGAILYTCLTGKPPFIAERAVELLSQVVENEPMPPRKLDPKIPADLETICLKCMEKKISSRYASAEALANDLRRWINKEPILARPARPIEHLSKWIRRKPVAAALVAVTSISAIVLLCGSIYFTYRLQVERDDAVFHRLHAEQSEERANLESRIALDKEQEARAAQATAEQVSEMLISMFESADLLGFTGRAMPATNDVSAITLLDRATPLLLNENNFTGNLDFRSKLLVLAGGAYLSLNQPDKAITLLEKTVDSKSLETSDNTTESAMIWQSIGIARWQKGDLDSGDELLQRTLQIQQQLLGDQHPDTVATKFYLGILKDDRNEKQKAAKLLNDVLEYRRQQFQLAQLEHPDDVGPAAEQLLHALLMVAIHGWHHGGSGLETATLVAEIQPLLKFLPDQRLAKGGSLLLKAGIESRAGFWAAAIKDFEQAEQVAEELFGRGHIFYQFVRREHASTLFWAKRFPEAEAIYKEIVERGGPNMSRILPDAQDFIAKCILQGRAEQARDAGDQNALESAVAEAEEWMRASSKQELETQDEGDPPASRTYRLSRYFLSKSPPDYEQTAIYARKAYDRRRETIGNSFPTSSALLVLWQAERRLEHDVQLDSLVKEQRASLRGQIQWQPTANKALLGVARYLCEHEHHESALFVLEQWLITGGSATRALSIKEFKPLLKEPMFLELIGRYQNVDENTSKQE